MSITSSTFFAKALSVANTEMTVNMNKGLAPVNALEASLKPILQALVNTSKESLASAITRTDMLDSNIIMDGTLTLRDNFIILASVIVAKDVFTIKKLDIMLSDHDLTTGLLSVYKNNTFTIEDRKAVKAEKSSTGGKTFEEMAALAANDEGGCAGACAI